ncbi:MAG: NAD-dependent succinate-semialdehyde dehydrogenase [Saprospiraceae bacterium]
MILTITNPANRNTIKSLREEAKKDINKTIEKAHEVHLQWKQQHIDYRGKLMRRAAKILLKNKKKYAATMTMEMGKPIKQAIAEVEKCAWVCNYYADNARGFLKSKEIRTEAHKSFISYQPLGTILAVMPWNYPLWQVFRFAAPTLMAGNAAILKHASNVPLSALNIEKVFQQAGFPKGLFSTLIVPSKAVKKIVKHPKIKAVTLTGSGPAGKAVASVAGNQIKKTVLELGGNDAYLILKDADLDKAVEACATSRLLNSGQSCIGAKRFIVVEKIYDQFLKKFKARMKAAKLGDPTKKSTDIGPMARFDLRDELHEQVKESVRNGARIILGGKIPENKKGAYYPATILVDVKPGMPAYDDELFGPVASVIKVKNQAEAIKVANDSKFGLGSAIFTKDRKLGAYLASNKIEAGACFVNTYVASDPRLPFGGIKESGYGRELSENGIMEFVNAKTIYIAK